MTADESLEWLYATQQFGIKLGLENSRRLLRDLGNPQDRLRIYHVAGTNGKGSVSAMLDAVLREAGTRCGLYTSPHLVSFRERIRINGGKITADALAEGLSVIRSATSHWEHSPTFFEIATALALKYFADQCCDAVVLETGMGGRLDATNAVMPRVSIITPIAIDHSQWLGNTLPEIAREKAGILKAGVPAVSAAQQPEAADVLNAAARRAGTSLSFVDKPYEGTVGLRGDHQRWNAALAIAALQTVDNFPPETIETGVRNVRWTGRFQVEDRIVLDGGHNPHAARQLAKTWQAEYPDEQATIIFGALQDKDYSEMITALTPIAEEFLFVPVKSQRGLSPANLVVGKNPPSHRICESLAQAIRAAREKPARILVTGSLFLVGEAMSELGIEP